MTYRPRPKKSGFRTLWQLRYKIYAILIMVVLLPVLYASNSDTPPQIDVVGYDVVASNWIAKHIVKKSVEVVAQSNPSLSAEDQAVAQIVVKDGKRIYLDKAGQEITDKLFQAGYESGFISSEAFVDLGLPLPSDLKNIQKEEKIITLEEDQDRPKSLDEIFPRPTNPQRTNFLRYPKYNVNAPIIYSSLEDLFNKNPDGSLNYNSPRDTSDVNSPVQQKLRDGVLHMAFTPQCGEIGNCYIVGHSSNYSFVKSAYNSVFKPLERKSQVGDTFYIYDRFGRELTFNVFEVKEISEDDTKEAYRLFPGRRVATLQTSILEYVPGKGWLPTKRWLTRGELVI
jgi:hypothetical protein